MNALTFARQRLLLTSALVAGAAAVSPLGAGLAYAQTETTAGDVLGTNPFAPPASAPGITDVAGGVQVDLKVQKSVINWTHFNIVDPSRTINFSDLSGLPAGTIVSVLNRVVGNGVDPIEASVINGLISSSSNVVVWISNPMGITFGASGVFSGGSLVLTTAAITTSDFRNADDDYALTGASANAITLTAGSQINAAGRFVAMGQNITNGAAITAGEDVALIAAQDIDLTLSPGSPISFTIKAGTTVGTAKLNSDGTINASSITLTGAGRRTAGSESDLLLEISGTLTATAVGGKVFLGLQRDAGDDTIGGNNDRMQMIGDTTLIGSTVEIASALDSDGTARVLDIQGDAVLRGALGANSALSSLAVSGTTQMDGGSVTTNLTQDYTGAVTLGAGTVLKGTMATFGSTVDGAQGLGIDGSAVFKGAVGATTALTSVSVAGSTIMDGGSVKTTGLQSYDGSVVLGADTTLTSTGGGAINFGSTVDSDAGQTRALTTASTGVTTFAGRVGATDKLSTLTVNGLTTLNVAGTLGAPSIQTTGAQTYTGAVSLGADTVLSGTTATFGSTVDGAQLLAVAGNAVFKGAVGASTALSGLAVTGATEFDGGSVTTTGAQTYTGAVTLKQDAALSGSGVAFGNTVQSDVDGTAGLTTTATSKTLFTGAVGGGGKALKFLTTNGLTEIAGGSVITKDAQTYNGAVVLAADTTLTSNDGGAIGFGGTVDSGTGQTRALTTASTGLTTFGGRVGSTDKLSTLLVNGGTVFDATGATTVSTTGTQTYTGAVTLKKDTTLSGTDITFGSTVRSDVDGAAGLETTASGKTRFAGAVGGGGKALKALTTNGLAEIAGGSVITKNAQTYNGAVVLAADTALTSNDGGAISFGSTVDSDAGQTRSLATTSTGLTTFGGRVGATDKLSTLTVNGPSALNVAGTLLAPSIQTTAAQTYTGAVTLGADTVLSGTSATFGGTVNGAQSLDVLGAAVFKGVVGGSSPLTSLSVSGTTEFDGGSVTTTGTQTYANAVTLKQDAALSGSAITFASTVQSDVDGAAGLTATATSGKTLFTGAVGGGGKALKFLTTTGNAEIAGGSVITKNAQTYNGAVVLAADTALTSNDGGAITFGSTVDSDAGQTRSLTTTSTGLTTFGGKVGSTDKLSTLLVNGGTVFDATGATTVSTTGTQTYTGAVTLKKDTTLSGTDITFGSTVRSDVDGAAGLETIASGKTLFTGAVGGGGKALKALTTNGLAEIAGGSVITKNAQTYNGAVVLAADTALTSNDGGAISFASTVDSDAGQTRSLAATSTGLTTFGGRVGATDKLSTLTVNGLTALNVAGTLLTPSIQTTGAQTYTGAVTLGADTVLSGTSATFGGTVNGAQSLDVLGAAVFKGVVGGSSPLTSLSVSGTTEFDGGSVTTTGTQTYANAVTLKQDAALSGSAITFASTVQSDVDGAAGLTATATSGKTLFTGAVGGGGKALKFLTTTGNAEIAGGSVITKNAQTYNGAVVLAADTALTSNGGGAITFASTVDSDAGQTRSLTATSTGLTTFGGKVGSTDKLSTLLVNGPSALNVAGTLLAPSIQTTGAQTYTGAVTLGADTVLSGTSATFGGTVNGAQSLDVLGNAVFKGVVGGSTPLTALSVSGTTELDTSGVTTTGTQTYTGAVTLKQDSTLKGSKVTFGSTVKGTHALGIDGDALFKGVVGGNGTVGEVLSALSVTGKSEFDVAGASMAPVSATVTTTGEQTYGGAVTLAQDTVLKGSKVSFAGIVDGLSAGAQRLGVLGDAVFGGNVGAATRLKSVEVIAPTAITAVGSINALEAITLDAGGAIALVDLTTTDTTAGSGNIRINQSGGSGPVTVAGNVSASGDYLLTGTSVVLGDAATRTQQAGLRIAITATAGNITRGSGALTLQAGSDVVVRAMAGSALLERTTAIAGTDVDVAARDDAELVNASATTGFVKVQAGQLASVTGDVSAKTDYTVTGGTGVVLGDGSARTQQAGGKVTVTATTGNVTQGAGLLTLQSDNDGTGTRGANDALRVTASNGSVALGNTVLSGGTMSGGVHGKQSDVFVDAGQNVTVKEAHGRSIGLRASAGALAADKLDALEDVFGKAGTSLTVTTSAIAGDDLSLAAGTNLTINQGTASGTGADGHTVDLSGAVLGVIADAGTPNLANITLSSATGDIAATTLTAQRDVLVTATTGNAAVTSATASTRDVKVVAGGNAALGTGGAGRDIVVDAGNNASLGTGTATNSILVRGVNDAVLGNATTTNAFVTVQAGKLASVTGNVSAKTDYTVTGGTGVVLGDGSARTQKAGGKVTITATTNDVTQGAGLLTLQSDSDGSGGDALSVVATAGSVLLGNSVVQGGSGRQSDVSIDAARNAALAQVDGRNIAVISNQIALGGAMTAATGVTLTNRTSETNDTVIGGTADNDGTKYVLSATEIGRITAPSIQLVTQQASGVTQNVQVGTFALKSGTNLFGIMTSGTPDTAKITLGGAITGSGFTGTLQIGGNSAAGSRSGAIIGQIDTATIDLPGGGLDLRAGQIVFGRSSLLTDAALLSGDAARIARDLVSNAASSLYIQGSGGAKIDTAGNFLRARSMRVAYSDFALFQNTGTPGSPAGVILGDAAQSVSQSAPTLLLDASLPAGREDAFALFGTINGFIGRSAGLLPESVVQFSTGSGSARTVLITQSNSRINGCVIGSPDKGCLVTDVQPPALKLFDERQAQIFSTGDDDGRVLLDPLIATNNEALIGDLAVPTLNYEVPACELTDAGECDKGKK